MRPRNVPIVSAAIVLATIAFLFPAHAFAAADVITVGTVTASSSAVDVPVSIRDVAGTSLGMDQPAGSKIQSLSIRVTYSPASAVQSVSFARAGITANLTPVSEFKPTTSNSASLLVTFQESTNTIPFTLNGGAPGNLVARLSFTLAAGAAPGSSITLTLDPALTQLTDAGGTAATKETEANGQLSLVNGRIDIPQLSVNLTPSSKDVEVGGQTSLTAVLSSPAPSDTSIALSSSKTNIATVPANVVIPTGASSASFKVTGVAVGTAKITATLGSSTASSNIDVTEPQPQCPRPAAPQLSAPSTALAGAAYNVTWNAVTNANEYVIEESSTEDFASPASQTVTTTSVAFTHGTAGARFYYRVRARNHAGACDITSDNSAVVSVLITDTPPPATRVLAVVGSTPGGFGSFFRTAVQLYNSQDVAISGKLVFHTANASGHASDPSLAYSLAPGKVLAFDDLLPAMSLPSGLGSVDLVADGTSALPITVARVFNDAGAAGTTGLTLAALHPEDALHPGTHAVLLGPSDVAKFRLNIGIRTLDQGATLNITVRDKDGLVVKTTSKTYAPTFFTQVASAAMLDGYALTGGETITFEVTAGSAFVYGSITDNITNDPSVQLAIVQ